MNLMLSSDANSLSDSDPYSSFCLGPELADDGHKASDILRRLNILVKRSEHKAPMNVLLQASKGRARSRHRWLQYCKRRSFVHGIPKFAPWSDTQVSEYHWQVRATGRRPGPPRCFACTLAASPAANSSAYEMAHIPSGILTWQSFAKLTPFAISKQAVAASSAL